MSARDVGLFIQIDGTLDIELDGADLATDSGLQTAVMVSLFTDSRVDQADVPYVGSSRRGWWGDLFPDVPGDKTGSRLWLLAREKRTVETLHRAEDYAEEALQWMIDDGVAESVDASASYDENGAMALEVLITKPGGDQKRFRFEKAWQAEEGI